MVECRRRSKYVTRHRIDHDEQTSKLCSDVTMGKCVPCCPCGDEYEGEQLTVVSWFWYLMTSELLLFLLHVTSITFGVLKVRIRLINNREFRWKDLTIIDDVAFN